jgi:outer membrane protein
MKLFSTSFLAVALLSASAMSHAADFKVGFVNTDRVFREAKMAQSAQEKLEKEFSKREKELIDQTNTIKANADRFEREAPTMSEVNRTAKQRQLVEADRELQRKRREFQEDLNQRKQEELQIVLERANKVVRQVAENEKYDVVLQEVVYVNPKHDITDKVITALDAAAGGKSK